MWKNVSYTHFSLEFEEFVGEQRGGIIEEVENRGWVVENMHLKLDGELVIVITFLFKFSVQTKSRIFTLHFLQKERSVYKLFIFIVDQKFDGTFFTSLVMEKGKRVAW